MKKTSSIKRIARVLITSLVLAITVSACSSKGSGSGAGEGADGLSEYDLNAQREGRFGDGSIPSAEGEGMFRDVYFSYDSSDIDSQGIQSIEYNVQVLNNNAGLRVQLEGHTDERGTAEYNLALGERRARSVFDALLAQGVSRSQLETISYGEEVPLDPGHSEASFAKNRRVHFSAYKEAGK